MNSKVKKAAALSYEQKEEAPRVIALGKGEIALKIIETAKENEIPVFENSGLVDALLNLEIGEQIPPELYGVVAEVLVFISRIDNIKGDGNG
ncbi:MAG TPA: EscU/YscU/HrcU family type III secretion system export apparatus switch protein [Bacillota bacterium]|nr:EscU/YscU/HrcU family type III secretion system export apparatus switch protein [Bacillota bacterium]HPL53372.1 EscU/YscU/HrcU family type III secretion system export apparatus switch protein [Bacillota bacterium]